MAHHGRRMPRLKDLLSQRKSSPTAPKSSASGVATNAEDRSEVQHSGQEATVVLPSSLPDVHPAYSEQEELLAAGISGVASLAVRIHCVRETTVIILLHASNTKHACYECFHLTGSKSVGSEISRLQTINLCAASA